MVMPNKNHGKEEEKKILKEAQLALATMAMSCTTASMQRDQCPCLICHTMANIEANRGVMLCAGVMALRGHPEMLDEITKFISELTQKYPDPMKEKP